jgi:hypothetical protein
MKATGEEALRWLAAQGASADEIAFLRGQMARGAVLAVQTGVGAVPEVRATPGVVGVVVVRKGRTGKGKR